jgi:hypothetical protein
MTEAALQKIFDKTNGHCHYCGDPLNFHNRVESRAALNESRRLKPLLDGKWHTLKRGKHFTGRTTRVIRKLESFAADYGWTIRWQVSEDNQTLRVRRINRR